jgi:inorganic triphosphatase YgiF
MIVSRYYDTPAYELFERGISLRLRRRGARWLQTVKGAGEAAAGMHRRTEYEWPLSRAGLDPAKLAETPWAELFAKASGRLATVFTTEVKRTERALKFDDGRAPLSFDQGAVRASRNRAPLCEIEIELVEGDARLLYDLALALCADIPLTLAHASKADQGYALAASRPARPIRAGKVALSPDVAAPQALAAIATDCLGQIGGNAEAMRAGRDGEFLHQLRVGIRRMRSLLKLVAQTQDAAEIASIDRGLVALGEVFGPARDWEVFTAGTLAAIAPHLDDKERRGFQRLRLRASRKRRFHRAATQAEAGSQRFTCLLLALGRFRIGLELAAPDPPAAALARDALGASERRLRKRGKRLREADAAARHRVRVAAKKLRYAAEFLAPLFRHAGANAYVDALSKLQGTLGYLNDMAAAARLVDELLATARNDIELSRAAGIVRGWTAAMSARELERLPKSWRQFAKARPFWN